MERAATPRAASAPHRSTARPPRARRPLQLEVAAPAGPSPELAGRLARIEQAIEAVAIEVERISESERYSARLLTERLPERAPAQAAHPTADAVR